MDKYTVNKDVTSEKLMFYGFVVDTVDEEAENKKYYCYKELPSRTHMFVTIEQHKRKFVFKNIGGVKIYVGNIVHSCTPETIKNTNYLGFSSIYDGYKNAMNDLVESGILVKKLSRNKKSKQG